MYIIRRQFRHLILEQDCLSESQAINTAYQMYETGGWTSVMVIDTQLDEAIIELGMTEKQALRAAYATSIESAKSSSCV